MTLMAPVLVVGVGGAGSRLAAKAGASFGADCLQISDEQSDFDSSCNSIVISTKGVINPSSRLLRRCAFDMEEQILKEISGYSSVVIIANAAGKSGAAISPIVSRICKVAKKSIISFAIMPFGFEKARIFNSGIALKRLREDSDCTIVIDNDAVLDSNPDLSPAECHNITNSALVCVVRLLRSSNMPDGASMVAASRDGIDIESSLRDTLKMLHASGGDSAHSILHIFGGDKIPVGVLNAVTRLADGASDGKSKIEYASKVSEESGVVMVSALHGKTHFDSYDPLDVIPRKDMLDWDEPEITVDCMLDLPQLE